MRKLIIAVKSCQRDLDLGFHCAIRQTWGADAKKAGVDVRFFVGSWDKRNRYENDESSLPCEDGYMELPFKTRAICHWLYNKPYTHAFLCDNDTFVRIPELLASGFEAADYSGYYGKGADEVHTRFDYQDHMGNYPQCYPWASGGFGYFLSKRASDALAFEYPQVWAEDMHVAQVLGPLAEKNKLTKQHLPLRGTATEHFGKTPKFRSLTPELLLRAYAENGFENIYKEAY